MAMGLTMAQLFITLIVLLVVPCVLHQVFFQKSKAKEQRSLVTLDDYINKHGMSESDARFQVAVDFVALQSPKALSNDQRLTLYAFYKQAHFGKCTTEQPSAADFVGKAKWESWNALGNMDVELAKDQYITFVKELFPRFDPTGKNNSSNAGAAAGGPGMNPAGGNDGATMSMAGVVSTPTIDMSAPEWQAKDDVFHYASTGAVAKVKRAIKNGCDLNTKDDEGRTMLHWAVDRSQTEIVETLLESGALPNEQDEDGMTPLHYAVSCELEDMVRLLMKHGASPTVEDNDGETPLDAASEEIRSILAEAEN
ncbi:TPA: hypothetical protein N0F65_005860 [Lagenidium giganteum]|uniref:ACB domain-containing protein n=1 Tax=Lagenidium giganteum TaxID=4803 RepID=A0AAV2YM56_9STRA|nr:TPA: hypothetical protein N0F65_005860 [Lagenidium giganteum]